MSDLLVEAKQMAKSVYIIAPPVVAEDISKRTLELVAEIERLQAELDKVMGERDELVTEQMLHEGEISDKNDAHQKTIDSLNEIYSLYGEDKRIAEIVKRGQP